MKLCMFEAHTLSQWVNRAMKQTYYVQKHIYLASDMAQQVKMLNIKADGIRKIPGTHR